MSAEQLSLVGSRLVKRCGTRDPLQIAADIGIEVMMCGNFGPLKGMYRVIKRNRFIFINDRIDVQNIKAMTDAEYSVRGCTALLDAIGGAIHHIGNIHKYARVEDIWLILFMGH